MADVALAPDEKKCQFCAEIIKKDAIVCKHCGRDLTASALPPSPSAQPIQPKAKPKEKTPPVLILVFIFIVVASCYLLFANSGKRDSGGATSGGASASSTYTVMYEIESNATQVTLTYQNASGDTSQEKVPIGNTWRREQKMRKGDFVYISAQMYNREGTEVICRIFVNGVKVKENTSKGEFTIATCSGRL